MLTRLKWLPTSFYFMGKTRVLLQSQVSPALLLLYAHVPSCGLTDWITMQRSSCKKSLSPACSSMECLLVLRRVEEISILRSSTWIYYMLCMGSRKAF